ncbi:TPA: 23S rRNA methyltransferase attenuation leader peptide [Streptococcus suis]|nr:23S rRNA methyltransferase attenuation leader peptide [Streptococcus suis]NQM49945.1 23S rRNA methyltransferase attenuation leader peptide [Streptococcus suis]HEM3726694.1 23S rRNA methyltransferase attenuation leader peptide [Streptococcus suis]HEM4341628.1 23S rRNA methyltransferase attenuation leader peptide [Streptococcus suis]HEM6245119.1 23S rRNA methyltransferase attenuation leader peptide [Streptococcus suis]
MLVFKMRNVDKTSTV